MPRSKKTTGAATNSTTRGRGRPSSDEGSPNIKARYPYVPDPDLWRQTIQRLLATCAVTPAQAESWLKTCQLAIMQLPTGKTLSAHLQAPGNFAAEHLRHHYAAIIRYTLQVITRKQVILFIRGPEQSPYDGLPDAINYESGTRQRPDYTNTSTDDDGAGAGDSTDYTEYIA